MTTMKTIPPTKSSTSTTMATVKTTSATTMTTMTSSAMIPVAVDEQRKIKISKWKPILQKKTTPRKLEDEINNSNSYYPVVRDNPGKYYVSHPLPPQPLAGIPFI